MTLDELIECARERLDDMAAPYLFSDPELTSYINEAINEACVRAQLIFDATTAACCTIDVTAGQNAYQLHDAITSIQRIALFTGEALDELNYDALDRYGNWETHTSSTPSSYLRNGRTIVLYPKPSLDTTINLRVYRKPLTPLKASGDVPEISAEHHFALLDWVGHLAYSKPDSETYNEAKADRCAAKFTERFGYRPTASQRGKQDESRRHTTRYKPF